MHTQLTFLVKVTEKKQFAQKENFSTLYFQVCLYALLGGGDAGCVVSMGKFNHMLDKFTTKAHKARKKLEKLLAHKFVRKPLKLEN